jgi:hypothetical protein
VSKGEKRECSPTGRFWSPRPRAAQHLFGLDLSGSFASEVMNQDMPDVSGAEPLLLQLLGHDL